MTPPVDEKPPARGYLTAVVSRRLRGGCTALMRDLREYEALDPLAQVVDLPLERSDLRPKILGGS